MCLDFHTEWAKFQIILSKPGSFADISPHISQKVMFNFDFQAFTIHGILEMGDLNREFLHMQDYRLTNLWNRDAQQIEFII